MSTLGNETTSSGRPTAVPQKNDRYIFGSLDSFGKNQEKLREGSWGEAAPEGIVLASMDAAINSLRENSVWRKTFDLPCLAMQLLYAITLLQEKIQQERGTVRKTLNLA